MGAAKPGERKIGVSLIKAQGEGEGLRRFSDCFSRGRMYLL
jgi:hypothetical protein